MGLDGRRDTDAKRRELGSEPFTELTLITRPQPRSTMPSHTGLVMLKALSRLVLMTASQSALVIFLKVVSRVIPALFTRTERSPNAADTASTAWLAEAGSPTSPANA